ncbi:MAG: FecR family protein [Calditerrivibrio sp.]|nr:FecR family protein [Calditerrivibrio sp.]MCA1932095.1 FecR family protein [Calditerrivibrio sp.]
MFRLLLYCFISILSLSNLFAADKVAKIKSLEGDVSIQRGDKTIPAKLGTIIVMNDLINTSKKSSAGLVFNDNTMITLGENTSFQVSKYLYDPQKSAYAFEGDIKKGKVLYTSGKIAKISSNNVSMKTPTSIIGVKGTKFVVEVNQ